MEILHPFGPSIGLLEAPADLIDTVNSYVCDAEASNSFAELDHSAQLVGRVSQEIEFRLGSASAPGYRSYCALETFLRRASLDYADDALRRRFGERAGPQPTLSISEWSAWIVRQFSGEYNPLHSHLRFDVSGVMYASVPKSIIRAQPDSKCAADGSIEFVGGVDNRFSPGRFRIKPWPGLVVIFPSHLYHTVYPFEEDDAERRALSFNAVIESAMTGSGRVVMARERPSDK